MKYTLYILLFFLASCATKSDMNATKSDIKNIEGLITEQINSRVILENKIDNLELSRDEISKKLGHLENDGKGRSTDARLLKDKINIIDRLILLNKVKLNSLENKVEKNSIDINNIIKNDKVLRNEINKILQENERLKRLSREKEDALVKEYEEKRRSNDKNGKNKDIK